MDLNQAGYLGDMQLKLGTCGQPSHLREDNVKPRKPITRWQSH